MYRYKIWVQINTQQTTTGYVYADSDYHAKLLAEATYGEGNVLNYTRIDE